MTVIFNEFLNVHLYVDVNLIFYFFIYFSENMAECRLLVYI